MKLYVYLIYLFYFTFYSKVTIQLTLGGENDTDTAVTLIKPSSYSNYCKQMA